MDDHYAVTKELSYLDNQELIRLGTALGLLYPHLKRMMNLPGDMVDSWLRKDDNVLNKSGPPTWASLAKALEAIDHTGIAAMIRKKGNHL